MTDMLENYEEAMYQILNVDETIGNARELINRINLTAFAASFLSAVFMIVL